MALTTTIHKIERKMIPRNPSANRKKLLLNNSMLPIIAPFPLPAHTSVGNKKAAPSGAALLWWLVP